MRYLVRRTLLLLPTLLLVVTVVFVALRLLPGDVVTLLTADQNVTPEAAVRLRQELGLDQPLPLQYLRFLGRVARADFGNSIWTGKPVTAELAARLPVTLELALLAAIFSLMTGLTGGTLAALYVRRWPDYLLRGVAILGLALPGFWLGTLAIVLPAVWWQSTPSLTYVPFFDDPPANLRQFAVPAVVMGLALAAALLRMTRGLLLDVLHDDYVRTARAKGLREGRILSRHVLPNLLLPVLTVFGNQVAALAGGTVLFERIFNLQGVGSYLYQSISQRDYPAVQAVNIYLTVAVLLVNLAIDLSYGLLDPRVRGKDGGRF